MKKMASLLIAGAVVLVGQVTNPVGPGGQTFTGVLLDASCQAIANRNNSSIGTATQTASAVGAGATSGAGSASALGTTGSATQTPGPTVTGGNQASATQGTSEANMTGVTQAGRQSTTAGVHSSTGATSGASSASAQGTTGAAETGSSGSLRIHTADSSNVNQAGTQGSTPAAKTGDRSRTADTAVSSTVREKYRECMATANTRLFAIHSNGALYVLDDAGNDMVRRQMSGEAFRGSMTGASGAPQWMTVTVQGTANGDSLAITSVRK